jgi:hypothetical protein
LWAISRSRTYSLWGSVLIVRYRHLRRRPLSEFAARERSVAKGHGGRRDDKRNSKRQRCNQFKRDSAPSRLRLFQLLRRETRIASELSHGPYPSNQ